MISDIKILVKKLWEIRIKLNPLIDSSTIDKEIFWKKEAEKILETHLSRKK